MKKNVAGQTIGAQMITAADGTAFTGTVSAFVTGDAGTQGSGGGTVTHEGNGYHSYAITQAETNFDHVAVTFTGTGAIPATIQTYTTFPQTGDNFARLGAPAGASVSADIAAVKSDTAAILVDTAEIGAAGAGLTALASQASVNTIDDFLDTEVAAILAAVDTEVAAIKAKTDNLPASPAAVGSAMTLTSAYDFAQGTVAMTEAYAADGAAPTPAQILHMIYALLAEKSVASTTMTVKKLDGTTTAMTFTLDSDTSPTSITRAS